MSIFANLRVSHKLMLAFGVLVLRLLLQAWGYGRALILGLENPVAVPLNLSVAEQARLEAEALEGSD